MGRVRAWEDTLVIPTYEVGPADRNPSILMGRRNPIHPGSSIVYPYPMMENLVHRRRDVEWKVICLENDYLRVTVAPDLGGHVLSVWDRIAGAEAIYHNHALKYARIGIRGAWVSGGIEWNFPNGHTVTSVSPIDWAIRENGDGSVTVLVGDIERVSRMRWSVGITLQESSASFETEIRLFNRTAFPNRYWFWANSAAPQSEGLQFVSTATRVQTLKGPWDFPVHDGVDVSWDRNHVEAQDMFCLNPREEFVGWYNHDLDRGLVNVADRSEARGTKFYTWGSSDDGDIWVDRLTDTDGQYAEMQSGRFPTMAIWEILPPGTVEAWREVWYPVRGTGAPCFANAEVAFSLRGDGGDRWGDGGSRPDDGGERGGGPAEGRAGGGASRGGPPRDGGRPAGRLRLALQSNRPRPDAEIAVRAGERVLWSERVGLDPKAPCLLEVPGPAAGAEGAVLVVASAEGERLAAVALAGVLGRAGAKAAGAAGEAGAAGPEVKGYLRVDPSRPPTSAEACRLNGLDHEKLGDVERARQAYQQALDIDAGYGPALVALGVLDLREGKIEPACGRFERALERDAMDEAARFYLGVAHLLEERFERAAEELRLLMRSKTYRSAAACLLGGIYLGQGRPERARQQLAKAAGENPDAQALLACALRRSGKAEEAGAQAAGLLRRDPLHFLARAEEYFLARDGGKVRAVKAARERLERTLRGEVQSWLELAVEYGRFGLYREALDLLALYAEGAGSARSGSPRSAGSTGSAGSAAPAGSGREALDPRQAREPAGAGSGRPDHPLVHYCRGYYAEKIGGKEAEGAEAHYRAGGRAAPDFVFPHRLESERVLRRALERDPEDRRACYYLGNLLCAKNRPREAVELWERAARGERSFSVVHRNLGRAYWKLDGDTQRAIGEYRAALAADPGDYRLYFELDRIYAACGREEERDRLIASIPTPLRDNDVIAERIAIHHADRGRLEQALEVVRRSYFYPWEVYKGVRRLYVDANIGLGVRRMREGKPEQAVDHFRAAFEYPRNIGVGQPYRKANAEALYRIGLAVERMGDAARATESWEQAAAEPRPEWSALSYYQARALQKLDRGAEAGRLLEGLAAFARRGLEGEAGPGPGTTSVATAAAELHYLLGLALKGLGRPEEARAAFEDGLRRDRTHRRCRWELEGLAGE